MMTNQAIPVIGTVYAYLLSPALILCLFKAKAHVYTPKMAEDELSAYSASSHGISQAVQ
jgi:hypothetical protein